LVEPPRIRKCKVNVLKLKNYNTEDIVPPTNLKSKVPKKASKGKENSKQPQISGFFSPKSNSSKSTKTGKGQSSILSFFGLKKTEEINDENKENTNQVQGNKSDDEDVDDQEQKENNDQVKETSNEDEDTENAKSEEENLSSSSSEEDSESDWDGDSEDDGFKRKASKPRPRGKKGQQGSLRAQMNKPIIIPGAMKTELSAYEQMRLENIKEREEMLAALMTDFHDFKKDAGLAAKTQKQQKKRKFDEAFKCSAEMPVERRKSSRLVEKPEDGSEPRYGSQVWDDETRERRSFQLAEEASDYDEEDYQNFEARKKKMNPGRWEKDPNIGFLTAEEVTPSMLKKVSDGGKKNYNTNIGTTCHQCRQKTVDTKTICRSGRCQGVRGQFCGVCLKNRYGEDAREALRDPDWSCPPCRNFCNCSICRNRNGKGATGILIQVAQSKGFDNVADYLEHVKLKSSK